MVDAIPRDVQLQVIARVGIDARVAFGIVGKLRVPQRVVDALEAIKRPTMCSPYVAELRLGVYTLSYHSDKNFQSYHWSVYRPWNPTYEITFDRARWMSKSLYS